MFSFKRSTIFWKNLNTTEVSFSAKIISLRKVTAKSPGVSIYLNLFMQSGLFYLNSLNWSICNWRGAWLVFIITLFYSDSCIINANSVDPDQMPHSVASNLDLHSQCSFYGTLGINGLNFPVFFFFQQNYSNEVLLSEFDLEVTEQGGDCNKQETSQPVSNISSNNN